MKFHGDLCYTFYPVRLHSLALSINKIKHLGRLRLSHHHGEDNSGGRGLDGPEDDEAGQLHHGEDVDLPQRDVAQVDQVRLVFGRHAEQFDAVEQLQDGQTDIRDTETQTADGLAGRTDTVTDLNAFERGHSHVEEDAVQDGHRDELKDKMKLKVRWKPLQRTDEAAA